MEAKEIDKLIQKYYDNYDNYVKVPDKISYSIENLKYDNKKNIILLIKRIIITILGIGTLTGGIVFAKGYIFKSFNLGKGIDTAVQNGYIHVIEQEKINGTGTNISAIEFLMDDTNISTKFSFEFDEEIRKKLNIGNIKNIELSDLIITDENDIVLYCASEKVLEEFCQNNNLDYPSLKDTDRYFYSGLNRFLAPSSEEDIINLTYNIYLGALECNYPKSKHLKYQFHSIKLIENNESEDNYKVLEGDWEINIDVPEAMYNRSAITYKVISCSDENMDITTAKVSDTGFEFGCIMYDVEIPEEVKKYKENIARKDISEEQRKECLIEYLESDVPLTPIIADYYPELGETIENCTYIENENNQKFKISTNPGRKQRCQFINGESDYSFYETFDLTKYDITNELKLHIVFYDKVITVTLQKND